MAIEADRWDTSLQQCLQDLTSLTSRVALMSVSFYFPITKLKFGSF